MARGRIFEYTEPHIQNEFTIGNELALDRKSMLPCFYPVRNMPFNTIGKIDNGEYGKRLFKTLLTIFNCVIVYNWGCIH